VRELGLEVPADALGSTEQQLSDIAPLVALVLYLCAENAEIAPAPGTAAARPAPPAPKRTKRGPRLFPPPHTAGWDVGLRIGAALRRATAAAGDPAPAADAAGRSSPRPHIRRAHWHTFRIGEGRTGRKLRWMAPVPVNLDDAATLPATLHRID
jgi:hypothetical protein